MKILYKKFLTLVVWLICLGVMSNTVMAQDEVEAYQRSRNEYVFTVQISDRAELPTLTRMASIEKVLGNEVYCFANQKEYDALKKAGYELKLIDNRPTRELSFPMWNGVGTFGYDRYLKYEDYVSLMQSFAANHSNCTLIDLGNTPGNHKILGIRIMPDDSYEYPKVLWTGAIHGNEMLSGLAMLKFIDYLLTDNSTEVQELLNGLDIFILPMLNPDGTYYAGNRTVNGATRGNRNGIDLNRNFPDWIMGEHPDDNVYQNETQKLMNLLDQYDFTLCAHYHTGACIVNYPWDNSDTDHADRNWWEYVSGRYVTTVRNTARSLFGNTTHSYMSSTSRPGDITAGYVRGCDWYTVFGGVQDYMNYYKGGRAITIEIFQDGEVETQIGDGTENIYSPTSTTSIAKYAQVNIPATIQLMHEALYGIQGRVVDAVENFGIEGATVTINNHDLNGSAVSTNVHGKYFRPIKAGNYSVTYSAPGYISQTVTVRAYDGQVTVQNVGLQPDNQVISVDFTADHTAIMPGGTVNFTNASAGNGELTYSWSFPGGTPATSTEMNPTVQYNTAGTYNVTLTVTNSYGGTQTLTKSNYITVSNAVLMHSGSIIVESGTMMFYDSGGANGNYSNDEDATLTFYPYDSEHSNLSVVFNSFEVETYYDLLIVYDGPNTSSQMIDIYYGIADENGSNKPTTITATNPAGALTFRFVSDYIDNYAGWEAQVICTPEPRYAINCVSSEEGCSITASDTLTYANETIQLTAEAVDGYQLQSLYYKNAANDSININLNTMTFVMPASDITVYAVFSNLPTHVDFNMSNNNAVSAGNVSFYDHGGPNGNYGNRENYTCTFAPFGNRGFVQIEFNSFYTENRYDKLVIYDGANTNAPVIGTYSGAVDPGTIVASNSQGKLTCRFTSDNSVTRSGWSALVTTVVFEYYEIQCVDVEHGTLTSDRENALAGDLVTLTATVNSGDVNDYFFAGWNVTCGDQQIEVIDNQFIMPEGDVTVSGRFAYGYYTPTYYELVESTSELQAGETYVIATEPNGSAYAMGTQGTGVSSGYNFIYFRNSVPVTIVNNMIQVTEGVREFVLGQGSNNTWNFFDEVEEGYLYCKKHKVGSSYVYSLSTATSSDYKDFSIDITNGVGYIENMNYYRDLAFDGSSRFTFFTVGNGHELSLFKKVEGYWTEYETKGALSVAEGEVAAIVYPNPTTGIVSLQAEGMQQISVFNVMGQEVMSISANSDMETLDLGGLDAGMYIIRICTENGIAVKRVNLMH